MKVLFIDRDGTLIEEPNDHQVDKLEKVKFLPGVFHALKKIQGAGFNLAIITNQDGLGSKNFPLHSFDEPHRFMLDIFASQGINFSEVFICPHLPSDYCECRKPKTSLVDTWVKLNQVILSQSAMVGDRDTDLKFAENLGVQGLRISQVNGTENTWETITHELLSRRSTVHRTTRETNIAVRINLDISEPVQARTGIGFFDHMLEQLGKHGGFSLDLQCVGDLHIDEHHTIEDCALALGEALRKAIGDKRGLARFGFLLPMDEARAQVAIDLSGRSFSVFEGTFGRDKVGGLPSELVPHFFRSLADALGAAIHITVVGDNTHHMIEACFKAFGRALRMALRQEGDDLPTTKGLL